MKVLVTGVAGFIGSHVATKFLENGESVVGIDNLNDYYDVRLKHLRLQPLTKEDKFTFYKEDLSNHDAIEKVFKKEKFDFVVHLGAQAGVRHSLDAPFSYTDSNISGFLTILECCRNNEIKHLIYASSSSVYGLNRKTPFSETDRTDNPISLYAATKKSNELMAYSYSSLYKIPATGLRFFTVYGPAGRPDMAPWLFTSSILAGRTIKVFNQGKMKRDFTYIDDIVQGIMLVIDKFPQNSIPHNIFNIGNNKPVELAYFIDLIEKYCGKTANKEYLGMQKGDVIETYADINMLDSFAGYKPKTSIEDGLKLFVNWYKKEWLKL